MWFSIFDCFFLDLLLLFLRSTWSPFWGIESWSSLLLLWILFDPLASISPKLEAIRLFLGLMLKGSGLTPLVWLLLPFLGLLGLPKGFLCFPTKNQLRRDVYAYVCSFSFPSYHFAYLMISRPDYLHRISLLLKAVSLLLTHSNHGCGSDSHWALPFDRVVSFSFFEIFLVVFFWAFFSTIWIKFGKRMRVTQRTTENSRKRKLIFKL